MLRVGGNFFFLQTGAESSSTYRAVDSQRANTSTKNVIKTRFQDVQNVNSEDVHQT